jgi:tRNA nucleotidyltransferase/poly(A) polymerase
LEGLERAKAGNLMPDYIYLLENRLSADQRNALTQLREVAREAGSILFLTGDAVRDLTSGHGVRDLEVSIHGNAPKLKKTIEKLGGKVWGEDDALQSLYLCFPGTVRVDLISTHSVSYPKPGKPVYHPSSIQEDLRRRDFTVNAMAISLNEGSFGLLMDPLNGAADIETRTLRLVSNYGFIEEPALLIRAIRYRARLGWEMDPRTGARYDNAKQEGVIEFLSPHARSQELEQIGHEEDGLGVLKALEAEGWMKTLCPTWTASKADEEKLKALHELAVSLLMQGVHADMSAAQMHLLTAKMPPKDIAALKKSLLRPGFVEEWNSLDAMAMGLQKVLLAKENATPSASYKLFTTHDPEAVLWLGFTSKSAAVQERYNLFLKVWPEARQNIPHALMQEMRITPDLPNYGEIAHKIFLQLIDGKLTTPEEMRAFLEPYSPPAPPPQVTIKRTRVRRAEKVKERSFEEEEEAEEGIGEEEDLDDIGGDEEEIDLGLGKGDLEEEEEGSEEEDLDEEDLEEEAAHGSKKGRKAVPAKSAKKAAKGAPTAAAPMVGKSVQASGAKSEKPQHSAPPKPEPKAKPVLPAHAAKPTDGAAKQKLAPVKTAPPAKKVVPQAKSGKLAKHQGAKHQVKATGKPGAKALLKASAKASSKVHLKAPAKAKPAVKTRAKSKPAKPAKSAAKKPAAKPTKKKR